MFTPPPQPLPLPPRFSTPEEYITSLVTFSQQPLFQTLCGGVHILDFFTRDPPEDLYTNILPAQWREYFDQLTIDRILDILIRDDLAPNTEAEETENEPRIPESLGRFILDVRGHMLVREFKPRWEGSEEEIGRAGKLRKQRVRGEVLREEEERLRALTVGMKPKKMHEVENFARLLDHYLTSASAIIPPGPISNSIPATPSPITHILDIGSGRGYLPRLLASPPYSHALIGIESKASNITSALYIDTLSLIREEKRLRKSLKSCFHSHSQAEIEAQIESEIEKWKTSRGRVQYVQKFIESGEDLGEVVAQITIPGGRGGWGDGGNDGVDRIKENGEVEEKGSGKVRALLISVHSCGDLVHHGLKSLVSVPEIKAVALVGCCYNLMTEKLTEPTFKPPYQSQVSSSSSCSCSPDTPTPIPTTNPNPLNNLPPLRNPHPRLLSTSPHPSHPHPHGFPLSHLLTTHNTTLNITARMMACQAPQNWTQQTSTDFFTRHFYRAMFQRVLVDAGVVSKRGVDGKGEPVVLGSLPGAAYASWGGYVWGAVGKMGGWEALGVGGLVGVLGRLRDAVSEWEGEEDAGSSGQDDEVHEDPEKELDRTLSLYEQRYKSGKVPGYHALATTWSLMAFCAGVVESLIVVDRWLWLKEHMANDEGKEGVWKDGLVIEGCWVEAGWEYMFSPRNLVVVGVKKGVVQNERQAEGGGGGL